MKGVITSAILAVVIVAGSIIYSSHMKSVSEELGNINDAIMQSLENDRFPEAGERTKELKQYLDDHRTSLATTGNHEDYDKIEMNIAELTEYINGGAKIDAISSCHVLDFLFEHLPKNYELKLENIL